MSSLAPAVDKALGEIRCTFNQCLIDVKPDNSGGAAVIVKGIPMGHPYVQTEVWIGFQITFQYPHADVYPHFTNPNLARSDQQDLGEGFGTAMFLNQPATQISRRSNRLNPETDTAALKLQKVIRWMKEKI